MNNKALKNYHVHNILCSTKLWQGKLWRIDRFRVLARENVSKVTLATLVNLEFGWVKY